MSGKHQKKWIIKVHPLVKKEDGKDVDPSTKDYIKKQIKKKLSRDPESYGEPLLGKFRKYRKLKVDGYRVVYRVVKDKVLVLIIKVGIRRDDEVYKDLFFRLKKLGEI